MGWIVTFGGILGEASESCGMTCDGLGDEEE